MELFNATDPIVQTEKFREALFSPMDVIGRYTAAFFQRLGYRRGDWSLSLEFHPRRREIGRYL
jgi:hypothetical protein